MLRIICSVVVGALFSATVGCGEPAGDAPVPVTGKVIYQDQPVEGARVTFHNTAKTGGRSASGRTAADGTFSLTTNKTDDGALPGDYTITISKIESNTGKTIAVEDGEFGADYGAMMDGAAAGVDPSQTKDNKLPPKYADVGKSGIDRSVVKDSSNDFEIVLE